MATQVGVELPWRRHQKHFSGLFDSNSNIWLGPGLVIEERRHFDENHRNAPVTGMSGLEAAGCGQELFPLLR